MPKSKTKKSNTNVIKIPKKIIIMGLGNPSEEYENTPHNAGFLSIESLKNSLEDSGVEFRESQTKKLELSLGKTKNQNIVLAKPITFMNKSGQAVKELINTHKLTSKNFILIHDDADLPMGSIRISFGSSSGGHKGVEDVIKKIKTKDFFRFRIGIGEVKRPKKRSKKTMNTFVTKKLIGSKKNKLQKSTNLCATILKEIIYDQKINREKKNYKI